MLNICLHDLKPCPDLLSRSSQWGAEAWKQLLRLASNPKISKTSLLTLLARAALVLGKSPPCPGHQGLRQRCLPQWWKRNSRQSLAGRTLCCIFWSPPSVAAHQEPVQGECSAILRLGRPTSPGNKGLQGLFQTELLLDVRRVWSVQQEVDEGHLSSSRLCGFASPHTLESLLTKIS